VKKKALLLIFILFSSFLTNLNSFEEQDSQKFICKCECFHMGYVETYLIVFLIAALIYTKYKLHRSELRQEWMRTNLKRNVEEKVELEKSD